MRYRRLQADWAKMQQSSNESSLILAESAGDPPEYYVVTFRCKGLMWQKGCPEPSVTAYHQLAIYLHKDYPRLPPALKWLTPIFHPNILPPEKNGGVCIGKWTPAESLVDLCVRIGEMVQYKNYNLNDPVTVHDF